MAFLITIIVFISLNYNYYAKLLFFSAAVCLSLVLILYFINYGSDILDYFNKLNLDVTSSMGYRFYIWEKIIISVFKNPLFGSGYLGVSIMEGGSGSAHSQYMDVLFRVGIIGFTFYFFIMVIFIFFNFNTGEANNAIFILANVMFVYFMFIMMIVINIAQPQPGSTISNVDIVITAFVAFSIMGMFALYTKVITDDKAMDLFKTFLPLPELNFIFRLIMFIPCIFIYTINFFRYQMDPAVTPPTILILLVINILVITGYILSKTIKPDVTKLILNEPIYLNRKQKLSEEDMLLYDRDIKKYKYSLSFWVNINRVKSRDKDIEILELSNKLKVLYNESSGELTVEYVKENGTTNDWEKYLGTNNFPLQKWNHIILNYNSGILDVFLNNKLLFSQSGVIIKNSRNIISSGEDSGLTGGICHVKYFNRVLTLDEIDRFYHKYKNSNPPVV